MISVIIPTYKRRCIIDCLKALELQEIKEDFEVIVVARSVEDYLQDYFAQVIYNSPIPFRLIIYSEPGNGPAKNFAVQQAKGDFIAFTDDDCIPDMRWLQRLDFAQKLTNADIVVGSCFPENWNNPYLVAHQMHIQYFLENLISAGISYPKTICGTTMNMLIRKETFKRLGGFDTIFANYHGDDRDFNVRWAADADTRAVFNYSAIVAHNHPFTFKSLLRTSFKYGIGIQKCRELAIAKGYKEIPGPPKRYEYESLVYFLAGRTKFGFFKTLYSAFMLIVSQEVKRLGMWYGRKHPEYNSKGN